MNKNITKLIAIATIIIVPMVTLAESRPVPSPASTPVSTPISTPANSPVIVPASQSNSGTSPSTGNPSAGTIGAGSPGAGTTPSTGNPSAGTSVITPPTPTPTPAINSSSSSSSGSRINPAYLYGCPMITTYMKYGADNDSAQVTKLQSFLKNVEKLDVDVNGIFDKKTESAVKAFQTKYSATTMGPWGATQGTGYVYITTLKQINKIACNLPLTLTPAELSIINSTKNAVVAQNQPVTITPKNGSVSAEIEVTGTDSNTITFETESETNEENTATVTKASIMGRFWNFLVYLFK